MMKEYMTKNQKGGIDYANLRHIRKYSLTLNGYLTLVSHHRLEKIRRFVHTY